MGQSSEAPEVIQALAKADEYGRLAAQAKTAKDRNDYERLQRKWLGIADGWRVITEIDVRHGSANPSSLNRRNRVHSS
jgi:transcription elongation GreA/GreB family factor